MKAHRRLDPGIAAMLRYKENGRYAVICAMRCCAGETHEDLVGDLTTPLMRPRSSRTAFRESVRRECEPDCTRVIAQNVRD